MHLPTRAKNENELVKKKKKRRTQNVCLSVVSLPFSLLTKTFWLRDTFSHQSNYGRRGFRLKTAEFSTLLTYLARCHRRVFAVTADHRPDSLRFLSSVADGRYPPFFVEQFINVRLWIKDSGSSRVPREKKVLGGLRAGLKRICF